MWHMSFTPKQEEVFLPVTTRSLAVRIPPIPTKSPQGITSPASATLAVANQVIRSSVARSGCKPVKSLDHGADVGVAFLPWLALFVSSIVSTIRFTSEALMSKTADGEADRLTRTTSGSTSQPYCRRSLGRANCSTASSVSVSGWFLTGNAGATSTSPLAGFSV
eukprot:CAMPEP_0180565768 /NCGR_PEP_ID=MMETSP1037_2-20121125/5727_1 /TAXON_ID=632150 /ORGANISM="Azadinium spinosum, Strain 3D9" /LENGTH=163 /DNA_ID=CAMNT_0022582771 /DNA_START=634 /DNA_END=1125 /DNA_ORIENTATION=+